MERGWPGSARRRWRRPGRRGLTLSARAHGEPIEDAAGRARELIAHHARRLDETEAALADGAKSAYEVSLSLFGRELGPTQRRFAVAETLSHLERLVCVGQARRSGNVERVTYTGP